MLKIASLALVLAVIVGTAMTVMTPPISAEQSDHTPTTSLTKTTQELTPTNWLPLGFYKYPSFWPTIKATQELTPTVWLPDIMNNYKKSWWPTQ